MIPGDPASRLRRMRLHTAATKSQEGRRSQGIPPRAFDECDCIPRPPGPKKAEDPWGSRLAFGWGSLKAKPLKDTDAQAMIQQREQRHAKSHVDVRRCFETARVQAARQRLNMDQIGDRRMHKPHKDTHAHTDFITYFVDEVNRVLQISPWGIIILGVLVG